MGFTQKIAAFLGISAYARSAPGNGLSLSDPRVEDARSAYGGNLAPQPTSTTRWYMADLEAAEHAANQGDLSMAARLMRAAGGDGTLSGLLSTRTDGLVRLPKRFRGPAEIVTALQGSSDEPRAVFDEMFPPAELARIAADGIELGVGVGELVPVQGRDYPVFVRLDPEFLQYRWSENQWYFRSILGLLPITPGDGRWVLHTPGGRTSPWSNGLWRALGQSWITKQHAQLSKGAWEATLANPARIAVSPNGASEAQAASWFRSVINWGINSVFQVNPGYDLKLLESNGRGWECFLKTIEGCNGEMIIALCGQSVTVDGGAGFSNSSIHSSIRADLIKSTADSLAYTMNTQGLPAFVQARFGDAALANCPVVEWDVTPPSDRSKEAQSLLTTATAIVSMSEALEKFGRQLDIDAICSKFGIPIAGDLNGDGSPDVAPKRLALLQGGAP